MTDPVAPPQTLHPDERQTKASGISAAEFQPIDSAPPSRAQQLKRLLFKPLAIMVAAALLVLIAVLWFLLTARALIVEVSPADAELDITGGLVFSLSGNYLLRPGDYSATAVAEGYFESQTDFRVSEADSQKLAITLQKKPGHVSLTSHPAAAEVRVDGIEKGKTPVTVSGLSPGSHSITLTSERYFPLQTDIQVEGLDKTQHIELSLEPAWGQLVISSRPAGATVTVNGEVRGVTPLTTELLESGELVSLKLAGFKRWQRTLSVAAGETLTQETPVLDPADALLAIASRPTGASITVNGSFRGTAPAELALDPGKEHRISLFLDGYQTARRTVQLNSGEETRMSVNLSANAGDIRILTTPKDAEIWIDGRLRGKSGITVNLPAKAHKLEVRKAGYASKAQTISPKPGVEQVVQVKLLTEKQARWAATPRRITSPGGQALKLFKPEDSFTMGASRREAGRRSNEVLREVRLERAFYLGVAEVTNEQFKAFQSKHSSSHASGQTLDTPRQPVVSISWQQAALYCNWLSEKEKLPLAYQVENGKVVGYNPLATGYRLPTEAEWAWAARYNGDAMLKYDWKGEFPPQARVGNYADISAAKIVGRVVKTYNDGFAVSAPVGSFSPNEKGLLDLGGNVSEWVNDYYGIEMSLSAKAEVDPTGPEKGEFRVLRGASWRHGSLVELRLSFRDYGEQGRDDVGFRVARYAE